MSMSLNNIQFRNILTSPIFIYRKPKNELSFSQIKENSLTDDKSPVKKKRRITDKYFKNWIQSMNSIYKNIYHDQSLNIYENKIISINDMFHLFLIQMNFESKRVLKINLHLTILYGTNVTNLDILSKRKYIRNKKLIKELIPTINIDYKDSNNVFIESSNSELYIDKINKIVYKIYDPFSLLDLIQESFIQNILYSYLPNHIANIYGIYKSNGKNVEYILSQRYFEDKTLYNNYQSLNKKKLLNILISISKQLTLLQKEVHFLHNDLKINNVCIDIQKEEAYLIDFGYSSLICNNQLIHGYFELELDEYNKNKSLENYTKDKVMTHQTLINDKYKNSADLFYLFYTILYYHHSQFKNPLFDILYDLFTVKDNIKGNINIFNEMYILEYHSFQHASFFMTKSNELFTHYFGNNIENIDTFYERFLPENVTTYLSSFIQK